MQKIVAASAELKKTVEYLEKLQSGELPTPNTKPVNVQTEVTLQQVSFTNPFSAVENSVKEQVQGAENFIKQQEENLKATVTNLKVTISNEATNANTFIDQALQAAQKSVEETVGAAAQLTMVTIKKVEALAQALANLFTADPTVAELAVTPPSPLP